MHIRKQSEEYVQKNQNNLRSYFLRYYPHYHFVAILITISLLFYSFSVECP